MLFSYYFVFTLNKKQKYNTLCLLFFFKKSIKINISKCLLKSITDFKFFEKFWHSFHPRHPPTSLSLWLSPSQHALLLSRISFVVTHRGELGLLAPASVGSYLLEDGHLLMATPWKQMTTLFLSTITAHNPWWRDRCSAVLLISVGWFLGKSSASNYSHLAFLNATALSQGHIIALLPRWFLHFFRYLFSTVPRAL